VEDKQWRNKGWHPGYWPRAQTKKLKKSHTKGCKKIFLKGHHFLRGRKNPDLAPGDEHPCYANVDPAVRAKNKENLIPQLKSGIAGLFSCFF